MMAKTPIRSVALSGALCLLESFDRKVDPGKIRSRENAQMTRETLVCAIIMDAVKPIIISAKKCWDMLALRAS